MQALRFHRFGDLSELRLEEVARPVPRPGELLVAVRAASVNPSDVKNVAGKMEGTTLPRVPGRDFAGVVVEGPPELLGSDVWGAGGEVGFTRDGTHAEFVALPEDGVSSKPATLDFGDAAASGVNFVTAWVGVHDAIGLGPGETILVTGASGGVGSSVVQLARWMGARSIGLDRATAGALPPELRPDISLTVGDDVLTAIASETGGRGVEAVFDTVGEPLFATNIAALGDRGRYVLIASAGERRVAFDILDFYHKRLRLIGVDSRAIRSAEAAAILSRLRPGFESGRLRAPHVTSGYDLIDATLAYAAVAGGHRGKVIVSPRASA